MELIEFVLYALALIITVMLAFDYISTALIIRKGRGREGNPLVAWWMQKTGKWWWTLKAAEAAVVWALVWAYGPEPMLVAILAILAFIHAYVLVNNYQIAWRK